MPVMRPLFFADPVDPPLRTEQRVFLLGSSLLVIPAWADNPALPKGNWRSIEIDPGEGPVNDSFQSELCLREGSILPVGPVVQSTAGYELNPLTLYVSLDSLGTATGRLYEDDWDGYRYREGYYRLSGYRAFSRGNSVYVELIEREGKMKPQDRKIRAILVTDSGIYRGSGKDGELIIISRRTAD